jgi:hypothetical protein
MQGIVKLTEQDWALLQPVDAVILGRTAVNVIPYSLDDLRSVAFMLFGMKDEFSRAGVTVRNYMEKLDKVSEIIIDHAPEILGFATGLLPSEIRKLPGAKQLEMLLKVWNVNKRSQEGLEKNLPKLVRELPEIIAGVSAMLSSFSLPTGTGGATSGDIPLGK